MAEARMDKSFARNCVQADWKGEENRLAKQGSVMVYDTQKERAVEIASCFAENVSHVTLVASPQWGKTGVALRVMYLMTTHPEETVMIHPDNTYVFTGMSDKDWVDQTKKRMPRIFRDHVFHRNRLNNALKEQLSTARDCLIVLDECHFGSEVDQTLHTFLKESGIWNLEIMLERNIKVLSISATPTNFLLDAKQWGVMNHRTIIASGKDCPDYVGFHTLLQENRIISANINKEADITKIFDTIDERWGNHNPRYHIFRVTESRMGKSDICDEITARGYTFQEHNSKSRDLNIDAMMQSAPANHHFIIIKGFWKAAKTLNDRYVGVCYEDTANDTVAAQGLGGRLLGFGKQRGQHAPILFSNPDHYKKYTDILDKGCDYLQTEKYTSATLTIRDRAIIKKTDSIAHCDEVGVVSKVPPAPVKPKERSNLAPVAVKLGSIPENTKCATTIRTYSTETFMRKFKIESIPEQANKLTALLKQNKILANVSFQTNSVASVSNLVNYYTHPDWANNKYHISRLDPNGPITVIKRDTALLASVKVGDFVLAHSAKTGKQVLYKF